MANSGQVELGLAEESLIGIVVGLAACERLPARPWPLAAACQSLASSSATIEPEVRRVARLISGLEGVRQVEDWLRALTLRRAVVPAGSGLEAHWEIGDAWRSEWQIVASALPKEERSAWAKAAQILDNCLSISENIADAAVNAP